MIEPGDYVQIPDGARQDEVQDVLHSLKDLRRNVSIRQSYEGLRDADGNFPDGFEAARKKVAEQHNVSYATVRRALTGA